ncbi:MAG: guanylate kinase [Nitrospirota bacterium]
MFIVSAPSGAGKTTLCKKVIDTVDNLRQSVSYTTRKPRKGEINDVDYSFITEKEFRKMIAEGDFVEWAEVHGNLYGTSRKRLETLMNSGFNVMLDIDTQGARQIRKSCKGGIFIFILPPSMKILRERLEKRKSNSKEDIERRMKRAVDEIRDYKMYDYVIVNDIIKNSLKKLEAIIIAERLKNNRTEPGLIRKILD